MRIIGVVTLGAILLSSAFPAESGTGSVCIAPVPEKPLPYSAPTISVCESTKLSVKIDTQKPIAWPIKESLRIDGLEMTATHRVVVLCNSKPQQSFTFRFSDFKTGELCLFINDLYKTVQLWESKGTPWCKCK